LFLEVQHHLDPSPWIADEESRGLVEPEEAKVPKEVKEANEGRCEEKLEIQ